MFAAALKLYAHTVPACCSACTKGVKAKVEFGGGEGGGIDRPPKIRSSFNSAAELKEENGDFSYVSTDIQFQLSVRVETAGRF